MKKKFNSSGAILIELAVAIPILMIIACAMHDFDKYARIQKQMEFIAHEMVNMLQTVSQGQPITGDHYARSIYAAFLAYFGGGIRQYKSDDGHAENQNYYCFPHPVLFCVVGLGNGKAKIAWLMHPMWYKLPNDYNEPYVRYQASDKTHKTFSLIKTSIDTETNAIDIWPSLHIEKDQVKMILEVELFFSEPHQQNFLKNLKFLLFRPKLSAECSFFNTIVVFTPKPGLFNTTTRPE